MLKLCCGAAVTFQHRVDTETRGCFPAERVGYTEAFFKAGAGRRKALLRAGKAIEKTVKKKIHAQGSGIDNMCLLKHRLLKNGGGNRIFKGLQKICRPRGVYFGGDTAAQLSKPVKKTQHGAGPGLSHRPVCPISAALHGRGPILKRCHARELLQKAGGDIA
jgi:hypothetical protein